MTAVIRPRAWEIDPVTQSVTPQEYERIKPIISEIVGVDAKALRLDNSDNVVWVSEVPTNSRYAYYFERMGGMFSNRRYNKGLIISLGPTAWDEDAIEYYLRIFDKRQDCNIPYHFK
jgi:hypothetical protein